MMLIASQVSIVQQLTPYLPNALLKNRLELAEYRPSHHTRQEGISVQTRRRHQLMVETEGSGGPLPTLQASIGEDELFADAVVAYMLVFKVFKTYPIAAKPPRRKRRGIDERCVLACLDYSFEVVKIDRL
ncbi:uncharacterized protein PHALS_07812 [Plasmopara halstedii]|uniref:Uncharacterized protein n=1 Tax=Plasmopara halstedii TaxID=4781 RepID=A0A0P1B6R6_PLAHL|nr:uncharacterized protein PHALS_07812 [Plasmopara halstedii]CEG50085.1 hypothetical protein PHALS_07812 [Plasmopara halstedii]|eukprot:XP_024586454.1 hypothetical protein PHALS_07812 [Plasmopara halstedii]